MSWSWKVISLGKPLPLTANHGLPIGSGTIESACRTVVQARMKQAGTRWSRNGAPQLALQGPLARTHGPVFLHPRQDGTHRARKRGLTNSRDQAYYHLWQRYQITLPDPNDHHVPSSFAQIDTWRAQAMHEDPRSTIEAVAKEAGVSISTVSRVMRGEKYISSEARAAVLHAMERLNYQPSRIARSLKRGQDRTGIICLLLTDPKRRVSEPFFIEFLAGATDAAARAQYEVLISTAFAEEDPGDALERALHRQLSDGIVYLGRQADDRLIETFQRYRMPLVNLDKPTGERTCVHVGPDNLYGAQLLTEHLLQHGHKRIAYIGGPSISAATRERCEGFLATMAQHGLPVAAEYIRYGSFTEESGYEVMQELLELAVLPTAILAASDSMAVGAIAAAHDRGMRVPQEMAFTGFDDVPLAILSQPPLTTVRQPIRRIGFESVQKLLALINGRPDVSSEIFPIELVVRQSCGCP